MKNKFIGSSSFKAIKAIGQSKGLVGGRASGSQRVSIGLDKLAQDLPANPRGSGLDFQLKEATQLQTLVQRRDYSGMLRIVTPELFRRGLRDTAARGILLRVEKDLLREAERLLRKGDFKAAQELLDRVVRLGGTLRPRAQMLIRTAAKKSAADRVSTRIRADSGGAATRVKKNGGGARAPKASRAVSAQETAGKKTIAEAKEGKKAMRPAKRKASKPETAAAPPQAQAPMPGPMSLAGPPAAAAEREFARVREERPEDWKSAMPPENMSPVQAEQPQAEQTEELRYAMADLVSERVGGNGREAAATVRTAAEGAERRDDRQKQQAEALRRTPHMDLSPEAPLEPSTEFEVCVSVDTKRAKPGEEEEEIELTGAPSQEEFPVHVTLIVSGHFELLEDSIKLMTILRSAESAPVVFKVRCVQEFPAEENAALSALFTYDGHPSGRVTRRFRVANGKLVSVQVTQADAAGTRPAALEPKVTPTPGLDAYDLTISVLDTGENDGRHFRLIADAPPISKRLEVPWNLGEQTDQIVSNYMKRFVAQGLKPTTRLAELTGAGVQLFRATPPDFQKLFWEMIDTRKAPKTIMVVSDDPYIPWELMVPRRSLLGKVETRKPLGVEFCLGRWIRSDYITAPQQIPLERTYVVAPNYVIASKNLKWAPQEAKFVCASFQPSKAIDPADLDKINEALREQGATLLHFICHGAASAGTDQTVYLRDMVNNLSCSVVEGSDEFVTTFFRDHTFVFLNACEVGRAAPALVGTNGFATTFLRLGASGVVAALWSVKDDIAHQVAETFYTKVLQDPQTPFAEILRDIRAQAYSGSAEDTYAAYCFYGSPLARRKL